jgi:hypothetical protein
MPYGLIARSQSARRRSRRSMATAPIQRKSLSPEEQVLAGCRPDRYAWRGAPRVIGAADALIPCTQHTTTPPASTRPPNPPRRCVSHIRTKFHGFWDPAIGPGLGWGVRPRTRTQRAHTQRPAMWDPNPPRRAIPPPDRRCPGLLSIWHSSAESTGHYVHPPSPSPPQEGCRERRAEGCFCTRRERRKRGAGIHQTGQVLYLGRAKRAAIVASLHSARAKEGTATARAARQIAGWVVYRVCMRSSVF